jgi:hypothetical protein
MSRPVPSSSELRRLRKGPAAHEPIPGIGTVSFSVSCDKNSQEVLDRVVSVLEIVCAESEKGWSDTADWRTLLPRQFVDSCAPEMTSLEAQQWLQGWRSLSQAEREADDRIRKWSLSNWIYWLKPSERLWQWWDASVVDSSHIIVRIAVYSWPFGCGAIGWLFRGSGAISVEAINLHHADKG